MRSDWKVGGLVILFGAMLLGVFATLKASLFSPKTETYYAVFDDAGGLDSGAQVLLAGVSIGQVKSVSINSAGKAEAVLAIESGRKIAKGTVAVLPKGFISIGDLKVQLQPPAESSDFHAVNDPNDPIPGMLQGPLESIFPDTQKTIDELNNTLVAFQELLGDEELKGGLVDLMKSGQQTADKFGSLAANLDSTLASNSGKINELMTSMVKTMENVQAVSLEVKQFAAGGSLQAKTDEILATMASTAKEGELLVKDLRAYTADPEMKASLDGTLSNFKTMSDSGVKIAADAEIMSSNGVEISEQAKELMAKVNKLADEVQDLVKEFKGTVGKILPGGASGLVPDISVQSDLTLETRPDRLRSDITLSIPVGKESVHFGLYDAFESNKLTLQLKRAINARTDLRYGVYASKPGVGVSYALAPNLWLRSDIFGLNDPRLDLRLRYDLKGGWHTWAGVERVFGSNTPALGVGIKR
ncbi:MlaD family protein [Kamptonema cortianum]|nr:MlaD family protein [Geitlerinema splendidum]MDK3156121.1 MlaD family protein [Kamptonema cortianum]